MPQVYASIPAEDLEAVDALAEQDYDGNRSAVVRAALDAYLHGQPRPAAGPDPREAEPPHGSIGIASLIAGLTACAAEAGVDPGTPVQLGPEFGARLDPAFASGAAVSYPAGSGWASYAPRVVIEYRRARS